MDLSRKKVVFGMAIAAVALLALSGCSSSGTSGASSSPSAKKSITIGAVYLDTQGFYGGVQHGVLDGAATAGVKLKVLQSNTQDDVSKESTFINTLVNAHVDAIILSAASSAASVPAIRQADNAHIPVICYNTCVSPAATKKYIYQYTFGNPVTMGEQLGTVAGKYFLAHNISAPKIGVLNCEFVQECVQRRQGFDEALKALVPNYTIVSNQLATDPTKSIDTAAEELTAHPDIDAFLGESGGATTGGVTAVQNTGHTGKTVVFGFDMTTQIAQALVTGTILKGEVDASGLAMGKLAIGAAIAAIDGKAKPKDVVLPSPIGLYVTKAEGTAWLKAHANGIP